MDPKISTMSQSHATVVSSSSIVHSSPKVLSVCTVGGTASTITIVPSSLSSSNHGGNSPAGGVQSLTLLSSSSNIAKVVTATQSTISAVQPNSGGVVVVTVPSVPLISSISSGSVSSSTLPTVMSSTSSQNSSSVSTLGSHMHIPRGAAVVANMAGSRTSQAITANAQRTTNLQNRGVHLSTTNWTRTGGATVMSSSTSTPSIITNFASTIPSIATTKFTRLPSQQLSGRLPSQINITTCASILRPPTITRVNSTTNLLSIPGNNTRPTTPGTIARVSSPAAVAVSKSTIVSPSLSRTVLSSARNSGTVRPPTVTSSVLAQPIRLTQTSSQRSTLSSGSYTLTPVQQRHSATTGSNITATLQAGNSSNIVNAGVRARPSLTTARLPLSTGIGPPTAATGRTTIATLNNSGSVLPPSRPQSNPNIVSASSITRPMLCSSRPASTGPTVPQQPGAVSIRAASGANLFRGISPQGGAGTTSFVRADGGMTVKTAAVSVDSAFRSAGTALPRHQQYVQMINTPVQKVSTLSGNNSNAVVPGLTSRNIPNTNATTIPSSPSIAVRITSSHQAVQGGGVPGPALNIVTGRGGSRPALDTHLSGVASHSAVLTSNSAASAAAAVLPPGTTITPALLASPPQQERLSAAAVTISSSYANASFPAQQYVVETQPISSSVTGSSIVRSGVASPAHQQSRRVTTSGVSAPLTANDQPSKPATASPRPSILRKRPDTDTNNGGVSTSNSKACKNLTSVLNSASAGAGLVTPSPPSPKHNTGSQESYGVGNGSSGSAAPSGSSSPGGLLIEEGEPSEDNIRCSAPSVLPPDGLTPRKKPRKQQLTGNELQEAHHSSEEDNVHDRSMNVRHPSKRMKRDPDCDEMDGVYQSSGSVGRSHFIVNRRQCSPSKGMARVASFKTARSPPKHANVLSPLHNVMPVVGDNISKVSGHHGTDSQHHPHHSNESAASRSWNDFQDQRIQFLSAHKMLEKKEKKYKPRKNHFLRHSDVRVKEDKKNSLGSILGQRLGMQKLEGWKIVHVGGQVSGLMSVETEVCARLSAIVDHLENCDKAENNLYNKDIKHICELVKANQQRSKTVNDQMMDAEGQINKLFDHKPKILKIVTKLKGKRQLRKKEKR